MSMFKAGDKVRLSSQGKKSYVDAVKNPHTGEGVVIDPSYYTDRVHVDWGGCDNNYMDEHLEHVSATTRGHDAVNSPKHYTDHPSSVECIEITKHMDFCVGNAMKYLWRCGKKDDSVQELKKAIWYIECKIKMLEES